VFIDPPYAQECCVESVRLLVKSELIIPGAILVLEAGSEEIDTAALSDMGFEVIKNDSYGKKTSVCILLYRPE